MPEIQGSAPLAGGEKIDVSVRNVGGIDQCEVELTPGVTILTGVNATNGTSFLSALGGVLGGTTATLKSDTDEGEVSLTLGGTTYARKYTQTPAGVDVTGSPCTDELELVDQFVAVLGDNPVRQAVENEEPLRDLIMAPVDTAAIEDRIDALQAEISNLDDEIETVERKRSRLPGLEEDRQSVEAEIEKLDDNLRELRDEVTDYEADVDTAKRAQELVDELESVRTTRAEVEDEIEVERAELEVLREDRSDVEADLAALADHDESDLERVQRELSQLRERKSELRDTITTLSTIIEFNQKTLDEESALSEVDAADDVTEGLLPESEQQVRCWTCGHETRHEEIEDRLDDLRSAVQEKRETFKELESEIEALVEQRDEIEETIDRRESLKRRRERIDDEISDHQETISDLEERVDTLRDEITTLESKVADHEDIQENDLLETYERISQLEFERGQREQRLADIEDRIAEIEALPDKDDLREQRSERRDELAQQRERIDTIERNVVETFNTHMDELLGELEFDNIARVWLERKHRETSDVDTEFELHVVRESQDGGGYEDELAHLSESERSVVGLVVTLAGYLAHEAYETVPFVLLDSLEAIDADRIDTVIEYFREYAPYLVVALLPEDAAAVDDQYQRISAEVLGS